MKWHLMTKVLRWSLLALAVLLVVSGLGITYFRVVETVTFGLLTKPLAFKIHVALWIPFFVLLVLHVIMSMVRRRSQQAGKD